MGDINQLYLVKRHLDMISGPVLEVGSKDYGSTQDFRSLLGNVEYIGTDLSAGKGVDVVTDMAADFEQVSAALGGRRFGTVICFSVLEHCKNPFKMAENITRLLTERGTALISVPFSWKVHGFPSDYWRFTADGVRVLFPDLEFDHERGSTSTSKPGDIRPIDAHMAQANMSVPTAMRQGDYGPVRGLFVRAARRLKLLPFVFDYPYLHPPVMVNMAGVKRSKPPHP